MLVFVIVWIMGMAALGMLGYYFAEHELNRKMAKFGLVSLAIGIFVMAVGMALIVKPYPNWKATHGLLGVIVEAQIIITAIAGLIVGVAVYLWLEWIRITALLSLLGIHLTKKDGIKIHDKKDSND